MATCNCQHPVLLDRSPQVCVVEAWQAAEQRVTDLERQLEWEGRAHARLSEEAVSCLDRAEKAEQQVVALAEVARAAQAFLDAANIYGVSGYISDRLDGLAAVLTAAAPYIEGTS